MTRILSVYVALLLCGTQSAIAQHLGRRELSVKIAGPFYLERSHDGFGIRSHGVIEETSAGSKFYPLPQSNVETYKRLRPEDLKYRFPALTAEEYQGQEVLGSYQVEGERLWFGNQYYDGEGECGVGAFGYFDMQTRKYVLYSPRQVARWEISALLVETDAIWLALDHFGEDISTAPGGLIRWDRSSQRIRHYPLEFVVTYLRRDTKDPSTLVLATLEGYALFRGGQVKRFLVEKGPDGKKTAVLVNRFPPPPSLY